MTNTTAAVTLWAPRLAAIAMSLFLALFALDAFTGKALGDGLGDFAIHLAPSLLVLAVSAISWRYPLVGAAAFAPNPAETRSIEAVAKFVIVGRRNLAQKLGHESRGIHRSPIRIPGAS